ncbi:MAG: tetratricopeptide repeat protein [Bacteroidota bacterium]
MATGLGRTVASIYNPDLLSKQQLIDSFVVRLKKFKKLYSDIQSAKMEVPEQHLLLIGLRGMGKTTLLLRLSYEVENYEQLNQWLIPLVFNEEEYAISRLFKFWETIAKYLEKKDSRFIGLFDEMDELYVQSPDRYEERAFKLLIEKLRAEKQKLLLFIDNFGDMFKRFKKEEKQRLREVLTTCPDLRIIAGSAVAAESFFKYDDPFFELFKIERLEGLNKKETEQLLLELGSHYPNNPIKEILEKEPGRVETLRRLTGGIPRTIVLLFEIFIDDQSGNAFTDLEAILDRVTPLYKHRMDDLPSQQQEIMDAIAQAWDAVSSKEIAQRTRLSSKVVSAALKQMSANELIDIQRTNTKNHLYRLHDRFFNIWYLMRMARKGDKNRVLWLIRFLEQWCSEDQLHKKTDVLLRSLKKGSYHSKGALYYSTALFYSDKSTLESRYEISKNASRFLKYKDRSLDEELERSDMSHFGAGMKLLKRGDFEEAWQKISGIRKKEPHDYLLLSALSWHRGNSDESDKYLEKAVALGAAHPNRVMGNIFRDYLKDYEKAEVFYLKAIEGGDGVACRKLGWLYENKKKDYTQAEKYYQQAIEKGEMLAWGNLGNLYRDKYLDYQKAEEYYLNAVEAGHFQALRLLGWMYCNKLKKYKQAEEYYRQAIEKGESQAWINLATLYRDEYEDYEKAEEYYLNAVKNQHFEGLRLLGLLYAKELKYSEIAERYYRQAIEKGRTYSWGNLADLYRDEYEDYKKAEEYYLNAIEEGHTDVLIVLGWTYESKIKNYELAEKCYRQAIEKGESKAWKNLATLYRDEHEDYKKAEEYYLNAVEEGDFEGLMLLGWMYENKLRDSKQAERYYKEAIEKGETYAWRNLGDLYCEVKEEYQKAKEYYEEYKKHDEIQGLRKLANLYHEYLDDPSQAEKYCKEAIDKSSYAAANSLAWMYFERKIKLDEAIKYAKLAYEKIEESYVAHTLSCILLWKEEYKEAQRLIQKFKFDMEYLEDNFDDEEHLQLYYLLLAKNQYTYLHDYFVSEKAEKLQLKDRLKPIWYALLYYIQDEYAADYLRMPPELKETVEEIIEKVEQMRIDYALPKEVEVAKQ